MNKNRNYCSIFYDPATGDEYTETEIAQNLSDLLDKLIEEKLEKVPTSTADEIPQGNRSKVIYRGIVYYSIDKRHTMVDEHSVYFCVERHVDRVLSYIPSIYLMGEFDKDFDYFYIPKMTVEDFVDERYDYIIGSRR